MVSTSTTQIEINRAVSLLGIQDEVMRKNIDSVKNVLHMRISAHTLDDAPNSIKEFLLQLSEGWSIDTSLTDNNRGP